MIHLLDINVLIALYDPVHPDAAAAETFFAGGLARNGWVTCPLFENGFLRIFGSRKYPGGPGSPQAARHLLAGVLATPGHQFWDDDTTLMTSAMFPNLPTFDQLTDLYLLELAVEHGGPSRHFRRQY